MVATQCNRYYLYFSDQLHEIMEYWEMSQTGHSGLRPGYCLPVMINI